MRLIKLITVNFKKLGNFTADFTDGLNIIAGENFKGKSTLLQAIEAALFGTSVVPCKKEHIPTWGQNNFGLTLWFALEEGSYYVLTRNKTTAKLTRCITGGADQLVANGNTPVTAKVEELLGLAGRDYNLFVQTRQGESSGILTFGATALNRKVEEFAGVELIDKVQAEAQRRATTFSSRAEAKAVADETMAEAESELQAATEAASAAGAIVEVSRKEVEALPAFTLEHPKAASDLRAAVQFANDLGNKLNAADVAYQVADDRLTEAQARFGKLSLVCVDSLQAELDSLFTQGTALKAELKVLQDQDGDYSRAHTNLAKLQTAYDAKYAEYIPDEDQAHYDSTKDCLAKKNVELTAANELVGTTKAAHQNLKELATGAKCPTCGHAKEDHDPAKLEAEAAAAKTAWDNAKAAVTKLKAELEALENEFLRLGTAIKDHAVASKALREAEQALAALAPIDKAVLEQKAAAHEEVRGAWAASNQRLKAAAESNQAYYDEAKVLGQRQTELANADNLAKDLKRQWDELPTPPTAEEVQAAELAEAEYRTAHEAWKERRAALASTLAAAIADCGHRVQLVTIAQNRVNGYNTKNAEARDDLQLSQKYARLVQFLRTRRQEYMKDVWDTIMKVSSKLVRVSSKGTISELSNVDGDFHYVEEGVSAPTACASGAQRSFIGTAIKVGLARALYGSDSLLVFDEPTSDCSEQYASSLAAMIASSARQVLLITHRENDQSLADHIINVGD